MYSQQRGPRCAGKLKARLMQLSAAKDEPKVLVLEGGFATFFARHPQWCTDAPV